MKKPLDIKVPNKFRPLISDDICQGDSRSLKNKTKDALTWIDFFFKKNDERQYVQEQLALKIGILSHGLIKWNDSSAKADVAKTLNEVILSLDNKE